MSIPDLEPDQIFSISGRRLGIEAGTVNPEDQYAKGLWGIVRRGPVAKAKGFEVFYRTSEKSPPVETMLRERIQQELDSKCVKRYLNVEEAWLCVQIHAVFERTWEIDEIAKCIQIPGKHGFDRIYLSFFPSAGEGGGLRVYDFLTGTTETFYRDNRLWRWWGRRLGWLLFQWFRMREKLSEFYAHPPS